ncbi:MAG: inositol monophosphatase family protein [Acidobacteriota bacterium]
MLFEDICQAARLAGEILLARQADLRRIQVERKGTNDLVTSVDREAEEAIVDYLEERWPGVPFLAEESDLRKTAARTRFIIDPLDGTTNYVHGYRCFAVSIAFQSDGRIQAGAVLDPGRDELFCAVAGKGAWMETAALKRARPSASAAARRPVGSTEAVHDACNHQIGQKVLSVAPVTQLSQALLLTGFPFRRLAELGAYMGEFMRLLASCQGVRRDGSAALDLCAVAAGRADGFWENGLAPWDVAAGSLLIQEAGGVVTDRSCGPNWLEDVEIVAAAPGIHAAIIEVLAGASPPNRTV